MPNWCSNTLTVRGEAEEIKKFRRKATAKGTKLSLARLYPEPDYDKVKVKPTFPKIVKEEYVGKKEAWWDWRIQHWGTKWDIEATLEIDEEDYLRYEFSSAWSPPTAWLEKVSKNYPRLAFSLKYDEEGSGFMGVAKAEEGVMDIQSIDY